MARHRLAIRQFPLVVMACVMACAADDPMAGDPVPDAADPPQREGLPVGTPEEAGLDPAALARLLDDAERYQTDALLLIKDGTLVLEEYFGGEDQEMITMSAAKSFVSLAIGFLVADGRISVDQHAADFLEEWQADPLKAAITIRHLLTHTSGLSPLRAYDDRGLLPLRSYLDETPMDYTPGSTWLYNNNGVDALAMIAELAAGEDLDAYLAERLFDPLGTTAGEWMRFPDGAPMGAGELIIRPLAMAKVGLLLARGGVSPAGAALVDPAWIADSVAPSTSFAPDYGLLWWRNAPALAFGFTQEIHDYWVHAGVSEAIRTKMATLIGRRFPRWEEMWAEINGLLTPGEMDELWAKFVEVPHLPLFRVLEVGPMRGSFANGWMGQYLFVLPEEGLVAVRMHLPTDADYGDAPPDTEFPEFLDDVTDLLRSAPSP